MCRVKKRSAFAVRPLAEGGRRTPSLRSLMGKMAFSRKVLGGKTCCRSIRRGLPGERSNYPLEKGGDSSPLDRYDVQQL